MTANETPDYVCGVEERKTADFGAMLSDRQREVFALYEAGYDRQEISDELGVARGTVNSHLSRIDSEWENVKHAQINLRATMEGKEPFDPPINDESCTGFIVYHYVHFFDNFLYFVRDVALPAIRAAHTHENIHTYSIPMEGVAARIPHVDELPCVVRFEDGYPTESYDVIDPRVVNQKIVEDLAIAQGFYDHDSDEILRGVKPPGGDPRPRGTGDEGFESFLWPHMVSDTPGRAAGD